MQLCKYIANIDSLSHISIMKYAKKKLEKYMCNLHYNYYITLAIHIRKRDIHHVVHMSYVSTGVTSQHLCHKYPAAAMPKSLIYSVLNCHFLIHNSI